MWPESSDSVSGFGIEFVCGLEVGFEFLGACPGLPVANGDEAVGDGVEEGYAGGVVWGVFCWQCPGYDHVAFLSGDSRAFVAAVWATDAFQGRVGGDLDHWFPVEQFMPAGWAGDSVRCGFMGV